MGIFKEIINWLAESGKKDAIYYRHQQLKESRDLPIKLDGTDPNSEYCKKHGETPSQTRLRQFEEEHGLR